MIMAKITNVTSIDTVLTISLFKSMEFIMYVAL